MISRKLLIEGAILMALSGAGLLVGVVIVNESGFATRTSEPDILPSSLPNRTSLVIGQTLPSVNVLAADGRAIEVQTFCAECPLLLVFLSAGCSPCADLLNHMRTFESLKTGNIQVLALSQTPERFTSGSAFEVLRPIPGTESRLGVSTFPTVIGVHREGRIAFVASGFCSALSEGFLTKSLH